MGGGRWSGLRCVIFSIPSPRWNFAQDPKLCGMTGRIGARAKEKCQGCNCPLQSIRQIFLPQAFTFYPKDPLFLNFLSPPILCSKGATTGSLDFRDLSPTTNPHPQPHQQEQDGFLSRNDGSSLLLQDRQGPPSPLRGCPTVSIHRPMSTSLFSA